MDYTLCFRNTMRGMKKAPKFIDRNLKADYWILIILGTTIPDTAGLQMII